MHVNLVWGRELKSRQGVLGYVVTHQNEGDAGIAASNAAGSKARRSLLQARSAHAAAACQRCEGGDARMPCQLCFAGRPSHQPLSGGLAATAQVIRTAHATPASQRLIMNGHEWAAPAACGAVHHACMQPTLNSHSRGPPGLMQLGKRPTVQYACSQTECFMRAWAQSISAMVRLFHEFILRA